MSGRLDFANLPDPRRETKNKQFALCEILTIALCAIVSGRDDWRSVADFGRDKWPWLRQFLPLEYGTPSHGVGAQFALNRHNLGCFSLFFLLLHAADAICPTRTDFGIPK
jgi:hypothetical protein